MTVFHFFDHNGNRLFSRSDAISFEHYCDTLTYEGEFPRVGNMPQAGMLVGWQDDDDLWEVHEVTCTSTDVFGDSLTISGSHIALMELGMYVVKKADFEDYKVKNAVQYILNKAKGWSVGTMPAAASDDDVQKERYRVTSSVYMYASQSTSSKKISKYSKGKYLTPVEKVSSTWWKMQGGDGRVGFINKPSTYLVRDGNAGDEDKLVTFDEKVDTTAWSLLSEVQTQTGYIIVPRVEVTDTGIVGRYIDVRTATPEYRGVRLTCNTNILDGSVKVDLQNTYTALVGIGKDNTYFDDVVWTKAGGFPVDKPSGQHYVSIPEALAKYGHGILPRMGVVSFSEVKSASTLLRKTYDKLVETCTPAVTIDGTIADLYALGYGGESMRLHDMVQAVILPLDVRVEMRISQLTRDLVQPERTRPVIGTIDSSDLIGQITGGGSAISGTTYGGGGSGGGSISDGSVTTVKLADGAVTADKLSQAVRDKIGI